MKSYDSHGASAASLNDLLRLAPDPDRAARVRLRCRTRLERGRRRSARITSMTGLAWHVVAPVIVGGFCVLYVIAFVATTLRLESVLP
jgi:hypothetical protein